MKNYKLGFRNRSLLEQLAICRRIADCIEKLPAEKRAALARIPVAILVADAAAAHGRVESLRSQLRAALSERKSKVRAARDGVTRAASALWGETMGDAAGLLAAGLELEAEKHPVGRPAAPDPLRAIATELEGVVRLRWKRPVRRCIFIIQMTRDPSATDGWKHADTSIRQSCEVPGLESGVKYWFRVAATNTQGQGPWNNPVCVRVR
jgi:hypothetical protein